MLFVCVSVSDNVVEIDDDMVTGSFADDHHRYLTIAAEVYYIHQRKTKFISSLSLRTVVTRARPDWRGWWPGGGRPASS